MRYTARAILQNTITGKILLTKYVGNVLSLGAAADKNGFWATPGGGLEPGETFEEALAREIYEETSIRKIEILDCVMGRNVFLEIDGFDQTDFYERYFIVKTEDTDTTPTALSPIERDWLKLHKWWDIEEMKTTEEAILPKALCRHIDTVLAGVKHPIDITNVDEILIEQSQR